MEEDRPRFWDWLRRLIQRRPDPLDWNTEELSGNAAASMPSEEVRLELERLRVSRERSRYGFLLAFLLLLLAAYAVIWKMPDAAARAVAGAEPPDLVEQARLRVAQERLERLDGLQSRPGGASAVTPERMRWALKPLVEAGLIAPARANDLIVIAAEGGKEIAVDAARQMVEHWLKGGRSGDDAPPDKATSACGCPAPAPVIVQAPPITLTCAPTLSTGTRTMTGGGGGGPPPRPRPKTRPVPSGCRA